MANGLKIAPFINRNGQDRFKVVLPNGNTFLDVRGYGYYTRYSAFRGLCAFNKYKNKNNKS
jgi:hypothetical protein